MKNQKIIIVGESDKRNITKELTTRMKKLLKETGVDKSIIYYSIDKVKNRSFSGDILLAGLPLMRSIEAINRLSSNFSYVGFIDTNAYSQIDPQRLLDQLTMINHFDQDTLQEFRPRYNWTFFDYFHINNIMKQQAKKQPALK